MNLHLVHFQGSPGTHTHYQLLKSVRKLMNKEEKIVEHRNSGLMFGNLACIRKLIFHIFKNKTVIHNILFHILLYFQFFCNF